MRMTVAGIAAVGWLAVTISVAVQPPAATQPGPEGAAAGRPATSTAGSQSVAELPYISYEDLVLLVQTSRRAFEEKATGKAHPGAIYRPPALRGRKAIIHLALRSKGY